MTYTIELYVNPLGLFYIDIFRGVEDMYHIPMKWVHVDQNEDGWSVYETIVFESPADYRLNDNR